MPIRIECDGGCGKTCDSEAEFMGIGQFEKKLYCFECAASVMVYRIARDDLHDDMAKRWKAGLAKLKTSWCKDHEGGSLPDG